MKTSVLKDMTGWVLLIVALVLGLVVFMMIRSYLNTQEAQIRREVLGSKQELVKVVVATQPLSAGDIVSQRNMAVGNLPPQHVSPRMVRASEFDKIKFKVLSRPMSAGEPVMTDFLAGVVAERFSDLIEEGERAVSLEARSLDTVSGMLLPGDFIDLYTLIQRQGGIKRQLMPVLERVKVLAAGRQPLRNNEQAFQPLSEKDIQKYNQITVALPLADAEKLLLAKEAGKIVYLLRNTQDSLRGGMGNGELFNETVATGGYIYLSPGLKDGELRLLTPHRTGQVPQDENSQLGNELPEFIGSMVNQVRQNAQAQVGGDG